jgi:hypothetical protein
MRKFVSFMAFAIVALFVFATVPSSAFGQDAPETLVVTTVNTRGWNTADTRTGGEVDFILDSSAPGDGALELTTDATTAAKAQYMHAEETALMDVTNLSYMTKYVSGPPHAAASYQLAVNLCGNTGFTTFVYEPYQNGVVDTTGAWQPWDVDAGQMWSSRSVTCGTSSVSAGSGGAPFYTLTQLQAAFPAATVIGFGINIGTFNPSYTVRADYVAFNLTTYDFEVNSAPAMADDCKKGGWSTFNPTSGPFKNQGQCVASTVPQ